MLNFKYYKKKKKRNLDNGNKKKIMSGDNERSLSVIPD